MLGMKSEVNGFGEKVVLGYDLDNYNAQISYCPLNSYDAETVSSVMGNQIYDKMKNMTRYCFCRSL